MRDESSECILHIGCPMANKENQSLKNPQGSIGIVLDVPYLGRLISIITPIHPMFASSLIFFSTCYV